MILLRAKGWQVFILMFFLPVLLFVLTIEIIIGAKVENFIGVLFPVSIIIFIISPSLWILIAGNALSNLAGKKTTIFKSVFWIFATSMLVTVALVYEILRSRNPNLALIVGPISITGFFAVIYCSYYVSKLINWIETNKNITFIESMYEIMLLWFFPIGIWIIQPRLNSIWSKFAQSGTSLRG